MTRSINAGISQTEKFDPFGLRLKEAFNHRSNKEIADQLETGKSAITAYMQGRIPPYETLLRIQTLTGCNLHWLLTGQGEAIFLPDSTKMPIVIVLQSDKGGAGTSSSATSIAGSLARRGFQTLLVDGPREGNCGHSLYSDLYDKHRTQELAEFTRGLDDSTREVFMTGIKNLFLYTFDEKLKAILQFEGINFSIRNYQAVTQKYDFVLVDSLPKTNPFEHPDPLVNELLKCANLLIVYDAGNPGTNQTSFILNALQKFEAGLNHPRFLGLFLNKVKNKSKKNTSQILDQLENIDPQKVFKSRIRHAENFPQNLSPFGKNFGQRKNRVFEDYLALADEILIKLKIDARSEKI